MGSCKLSPRKVEESRPNQNYLTLHNTELGMSRSEWQAFPSRLGSLSSLHHTSRSLNYTIFSPTRHSQDQFIAPLISAVLYRYVPGLNVTLVASYPYTHNGHSFRPLVEFFRPPGGNLASVRTELTLGPAQPLFVRPQ
jgi:hypothetical protein